MDSSRFLIIGAYGQLGKALQERFPKAIAVDRDGLDITNAAALEAFDWSKVDVVLNAAAYTNVDGAEKPEGRVAAWQINAQAVANLARVATKRDLTMVHVSSEYVFDGTKVPHTEDEPVSPLGVYAQTKAAGDIVVGAVPKHYVARVSWLIGDGPNFVRTMMGLAAKNISPKVVNDQVGRLTFTKTLVDGIEKLLESKSGYGIYNLSNGGEPADWAEITRAIFGELGRDDLTVTGISTKEYFQDKPEAAPRPLQSAMDLSKIEAEGVKPRDWRQDLAEYIKNETRAR
ncbi:MAG: dTDP-4-dehydrorhamnose reductase [Patescibacteria group bacterium]|nr:dTDP-4-dehydrorhamnose reductase [Patescibacteria group bacterium]